MCFLSYCQTGAEDTKQRPAPPKQAKQGNAKNKAKAKRKKPEMIADSEEIADPDHPEPPEGHEADDDQQRGLMEELEEIPVAQASQHPHRQVEALIKDDLP